MLAACCPFCPWSGGGVRRGGRVDCAGRAGAWWCGVVVAVRVRWWWEAVEVWGPVGRGGPGSRDGWCPGPVVVVVTVAQGFRGSGLTQSVLVAAFTVSRSGPGLPPLHLKAPSSILAGRSFTAGDGCRAVREPGVAATCSRFAPGSSGSCGRLSGSGRRGGCLKGGAAKTKGWRYRHTLTTANQKPATYARRRSGSPTAGPGSWRRKWWTDSGGQRLPSFFLLRYVPLASFPPFIGNSVH